MNILLKTGCLVIYLFAVIGAYITLPFEAASVVRNGAVILLGLHTLELLVFFKFVRRYPGPLIDSIALTLMFGLLHWLPLVRGSSPKDTGRAVY